MSKYFIKKVFEPDGIWFRAYDEKDNYVMGTVDSKAGGSETKLRYALSLSAKTEPPQVVKEIEI
jgi:hypothetical protein